GQKGVLQSLSLQPGQWVNPGQELARVAGPEKLKAVVRVPETQARDLALGLPADVDTRNGIVKGHVSRVDPGATGGTVSVDIALDGELPRGARPDLSVEKPLSEAPLVRALKRNPESLEALHGLILIRIEQKRRAEAVAFAERFTDAIAEAPEWQNISAYRAGGALWLALGEEALARQSIRYARELDPRGLEILRLAKLLGAGEGADDDPTPSDAYVSLGRAHAGLGDPAGAEARLREALKLIPAHLEALSTITFLMLSERRPKEALAYSDQLIAASEAPHPKSWELAGRYNQLPWEHAALYTQRARILLELNDEAGARKSLKRALSILPNDEEAQALLADIPLRKAREAKRLLELKAIATPPAVIVTPEDRAAVLVERARSERERKDDKAAAASLAQALAASPGNFQALEASARLAADRGRPREALAYCDRILKASVKMAPADVAAIYAQRARLQRELGDAAGEKRSLERALALSPEHLQVLAALTQLEIQGRRLKTAMVYAEALVKASQSAAPSQRAAAYRQRASVRLELKEEGAAQEDYKRALEALPEDLSALWMVISAVPGSPSEALALVEAHRPAGPDLQGEWLALRGLARARRNDRASAEEDMRAAVTSDPAGVCSGPLFQIRRDRLEPFYFDRCVERFPAEAKLYADRGVARYARGETEGAILDFRKAAALRPQDFEAHVSLASALAALGQMEEALREADKAAGLAKGLRGPVLAQIHALQRRLREPKRGVSRP
ncbi:MAG: HlyD family efflux transporter periplasmic adaptor subunit, partial [Elusimicrobiota bacterium]